MATEEFKNNFRNSIIINIQQYFEFLKEIRDEKTSENLAENLHLIDKDFFLFFEEASEKFKEAGNQELADKYKLSEEKFLKVYEIFRESKRKVIKRMAKRFVKAKLAQTEMDSNPESLLQEED